MIRSGALLFLMRLAHPGESIGAAFLCGLIVGGLLAWAFRAVIYSGFLKVAFALIVTGLIAGALLTWRQSLAQLTMIYGTMTFLITFVFLQDVCSHKKAPLPAQT